jgi:hypothetical protein
MGTIGRGLSIELADAYGNTIAQTDLIILKNPNL